jgi:hypothetical protein
MPNCVIAWGISSSKYVNTSVENALECMNTTFGGNNLAMKATAPCFLGYKAELDESPELGAEKDNFYQLQIGILLCCVKLGCIDIITGVPVLSFFSVF